MEPLNLFNQEFYLSQRVKKWGKRLLGKDFGGPEAVFTSLVKGLTELSQPFRLNSQFNKPIGLACLLSGVKTLRWLLKQKQRGLISKLVAGPNLVISPLDSQGILINKLIDVVVVPSKWVKDYYLHIAPQLSGKIFIWPAGVNIPKPATIPKTLDFLIYNKLDNYPMVNQITDFLKAKNFSYLVLDYGQFGQKRYFDLLAMSRFEIYLSESESQGLAMLESWARNVPTLVWERGFWQAGKTSWHGLTASPYLNEQVGERFRDFSEFEKIFPVFTSKVYTPENYARKNFSNRVCAQKYLDIIRQVKN